MMSIVTMKLDAISGTIEIEADAEVFDRVATRAAELLNSLQKVGPTQRNVELGKGPTRTDPDASDPLAAVSSEPTAGESSAHKPKKSRKKSGGNVRNLKIIDNLLTEAQRSELKKFYAEKSPKAQYEILAVLCVKLKEILSKDRFSHDELHTAIHAVNQKTPGNLTAAINNMISRQKLGKFEDGLFFPNFKCDDLVNHDLPKQKGSDD